MSNYLILIEQSTCFSNFALGIWFVYQSARLILKSLRLKKIFRNENSTPKFRVCFNFFFKYHWVKKEDSAVLQITFFLSFGKVISKFFRLYVLHFIIFISGQWLITIKIIKKTLQFFSIWKFNKTAAAGFSISEWLRLWVSFFWKVMQLHYSSKNLFCSYALSEKSRRFWYLKVRYRVGKRLRISLFASKIFNTI